MTGALGAFELKSDAGEIKRRWRRPWRVRRDSEVRIDADGAESAVRNGGSRGLRAQGRQRRMVPVEELVKKNLLELSQHRFWLPNGSRLSCGRLARRHKGSGRTPAPAGAQTLRFH